MDQAFETSYDAWMKKQIAESTGERCRRLREHGYLEKKLLLHVWWPAVGTFEHLHAEYEVADFRDGVRFLDFAYLRLPHRICLEADGYGPHARHADRHKFSDDLTRQNHLVIDDWRVLRFSADDIEHHPRKCQQIVLQLLGRLYGGNSDGYAELPVMKREILRYAAYSAEPVRPSAIRELLRVGDKTARKLLRELAAEGYLAPLNGTHRFHSYRLVRSKVRL
jgi:very-short-patch-repair endonuclease